MNDHKITALDYVVRNWPTHGDPMLEETRQEALHQLDQLYGQARGGQDKTRSIPRGQPVRFGVATGELYRGVMIYSLPNGSTMIFGEAGQEYPFLDRAEAQAFVDASRVLCGLATEAEENPYLVGRGSVSLDQA